MRSIPEQMALLEINNVRKQYLGETQFALNDFSLTVDEGEFVTLVGESGCGKSTLLKMVQGLEQCDKGEIFFEGKKVKGPLDVLVPGHPDIALVHQEFDLFPNHTIPELLGVKLRKFSEEYEEDRIEYLLDLCDLRELKGKKPRNLSGGQVQRVAIAFALCDEPDLLLLDEPFSHIDAPHRYEFKRFLRKLAKESGLTMMLVTHDGMDALSLGSRIVMMRNGQIVQDGQPHYIYQNPANAYVASFFGVINLIEEPLSIELKCPCGSIIRSESITITDEGVQGRVLESQFFGAYNLLVIEVADQEMFVFDHGKGRIVGDEVFLTFHLDHILYF